MVITVILHGRDGTIGSHSHIRDIRFKTKNIPQLMVGDTFRIDIFGRHGSVYPPCIESRHWEGENLVLSSRANFNLLEMLIKVKGATVLPNLPGHYVLPFQKWSYTQVMDHE